MIMEWLYNPFVMYRLVGNMFTESGESRLCQAEQERKKLTEFETLCLFI